MAFMMPVVKNDWDIYKSNRSRKTSECNTSCTPGRTRKISECRSEGQGSCSGAKVDGSFTKHHSMPDRMSFRGFSRTKSSSENFPSRGRASAPPSREDSESVSHLKRANSDVSWLDRLKKFMKNKSEGERSKS